MSQALIEQRDQRHVNDSNIKESDIINTARSRFAKKNNEDPLNTKNKDVNFHDAHSQYFHPVRNTKC